MSIILTLVATAAAAFWGGNPPIAFDANGEPSLTVDDATAPFATLTLEACSGNDHVMGPANIDLASASTVFGPDTTCGVTLDHTGTVTINGTGISGSAGFTVKLALPDLSWTCSPGLSGGTDEADPDSYVLEFLSPGWTSPSELGLVAGQHVQLGTSHPLHDTLRDRVIAGAAI